ncbi:hypothetical protein [Coleofasciculus sp. H7-2]|uniref:hypothetical protein n=1 Tax=Coleofasciculus sp. H7-2 TaxID=3351545 RepID=UPI0036700B3B
MLLIIVKYVLTLPVEPGGTQGNAGDRCGTLISLGKPVLGYKATKALDQLLASTNLIKEYHLHP